MGKHCIPEPLPIPTPTPTVFLSLFLSLSLSLSPLPSPLARLRRATSSGTPTALTGSPNGVERLITPKSRAAISPFSSTSVGHHVAPTPD
jgi:hypothetical protein